MQRLQFTCDMAKWLCNFSDTEIWKVFRAITELIYEWVEPKLPDKLLWYYFAIKPYIEDDIERHRKYVEWKKKWWIESWKVRKQKATIKVRKQNRSNWTEWTKWTEWTTDNDNDIYTNNIDIVNNIKEEEKEKLRKEFPNKNLEVEIKKMCNNWAGKNKQIKKPLSALRNWLLPKKRETDYIQDITEKTDKQRIEEFLAGKMKFYEKYWYPKYEEVKDKRIAECLRQPLSLN